MNLGAVKLVRQDEGEVLDVLGVDVRFLVRGEDTGSAWSTMDTTVPEGAGPPAHFHPWDEAYYVTFGEVEFTVEGQVRRVGAGDFLFAPANTVHAFRGVSKQPARMLILDTPAHAEGFFRELHQKVRNMPADAVLIPGIGASHQTTFLPPS